MNLDFLNKLRLKRFSLPGEEVLKNTLTSLSFSQKVIFYFFLFLLVLSFFGLLFNLNNQFLVTVPEKGGSLTEGIIGTPRFVNPLLAVSEADRDTTALVYSGLMRPGPDGSLIPDLAESYSISDDGLVYTFKIKKNTRFHDGKPITADDVEFTILKAQDPTLKSPRRGNWEGITIEKLGSDEVNLILKQPYAPFLENTTMGILPKHIWKDTTSDEFPFSPYNVEPIGSGPYKIDDVNRNSSGIPDQYRLKAFSKYALGEPFITNITLKFYQNEDSLLNAFEKGKVESVNGIPPEAALSLEKDGQRVERVTLPRAFGVFFNQNQAAIFTNKEVRIALDTALDKKKMVESVLLGYGSVLNGPIPSNEVLNLNESTSTQDRISEARAILEKSGWKLSSTTSAYEKKAKSGTQILSFSIATGDSLELKKAAQDIRGQWQSLGAQVDVQIYEMGDLNQNIIRPRKYESLFFGEVIGRELDLYPFWHSSQRNDPGLNIALYANITADKLLEEARTSSDSDIRKEKYEKFTEEIEKDRPVVFIYSPDFLYVVPKRIKGLKLTKLTVPSERFLNVRDWYIETSKVWKIFQNL